MLDDCGARWEGAARPGGGWLGGCGVGDYGHLPYVIDAKERGRDIVAVAHQRPRGACTEIEVPGGLSGEALTMTINRRRIVSAFPRAKAAPGSKHHRPVRQFRPRLSGTIRTRGLASLGSLVGAMRSSM
jgi:hypothetical protein